MAYSDIEKQDLFDSICDTIVNGKSLRSALMEVSLPAKTFFAWLRDDDSKCKQYARATEERAELMFEDIFDIADESPERIITKTGEIIDAGHIQDKKVRIDARKWALSKLMPKKYGDKIDVTTNGNDVSNIPLTLKIVDE